MTRGFPRPRAILFDSDGLLVDTERLFFEATAAAFAAAGVTIPHESWARWFLAEGRRSREIARLLGMAPGAIDSALEDRDRRFWSAVGGGVEPFPGVRESLERLKRRFRIAVVTGAERAHFDRVHAASGLARLFEFVVSADDVPRPKPDPSCYLLALERLELPPGDCLAVEDSPRGARAAVDAGLSCCVVPTAMTDLSLCPDSCMIVPDLIGLEQRLGGGSGS